MSVTILPSRSNIEISNAQQIETIETLEMKIESTHVARALFIAWKYLSGRHFVLFIYWSATLWAWIEIYEPFHFGTAKRITMTTSLDPLIPQNGTHAMSHQFWDFSKSEIRIQVPRLLPRSTDLRSISMKSSICGGLNHHL